MKIVAAPTIAEFLNSDYAERLGDLARRRELSIEVKPEPLFPPAEFKVLAEFK